MGCGEDRKGRRLDGEGHGAQEGKRGTVCSEEIPGRIQRNQAAGRKGMSVFGGDRGHEQAGTNFPRRGEFAGAGDEYLTGFL